MVGRLKGEITPRKQLSGTMQAKHTLQGDIGVGLMFGDGKYLSINGGTLKGDLVLANDPTQEMHATTKRYVDKEVANVDVDPNTISNFDILEMMGGI